MADLFELDESVLSSIDYHWLWGLRYSPRPRAVNIAIALKTLLADDERLSHIIAQQDLLASRYAVVRLFYWLFNIDNYSYHSYLLVACKAYGTYLDNDFENGARMKQAHEGSWRLLENFSTALMRNFSYIRLRFYRALGAIVAVAVAAEIVENEDIDEAFSSTALVVQKTLRAEAPAVACIVADDEGESVIVTEAMRPHLEALDLHLSRGDLLSIAALKSASRARYLASHPDRVGGSHAAFCRVQEAAACLREMISIGLDADASEEVAVGAESPNESEDLDAELAALDAMLKAQKKAFEADSQVRTHLLQVRTQLSQSRAQGISCQKLDKVSREIFLVSQEFDNVTEELDKVSQELTRVYQEFKRVPQELTWLAPALARLSQEFNRLYQEFNRLYQDLAQVSQALDLLFQEHARAPEREGQNAGVVFFAPVRVNTAVLPDLDEPGAAVPNALEARKG